jgi:hypothetical protein
VNDVNGVILNNGVGGGGHCTRTGGLIVITAFEVERVIKNARTWRMAKDLRATERNRQHTIGQREFEAIRGIQGRRRL